jgi:hypothetical protein
MYGMSEHFPHASPHTIATTIRAKLPPGNDVDLALYFNLGGGRGVRTAMCQNAMDPNHVLHLFSAGTLIVLCCLALGGRGWSDRMWTAFVSLPPFVFLWVLANDHSRWVTFSIMNVWLYGVFRLTCEKTGHEKMWSLVRFTCAILIMACHHPQLFRTAHRIYVPSPLIENIAVKLGRPRTPGLAAALQVCDPEWRDVVDY